MKSLVPEYFILLASSLPMFVKNVLCIEHVSYLKCVSYCIAVYVERRWGCVFVSFFLEYFILIDFQVFLISPLYFSNVYAKNVFLAAHNYARS